MNFQEAERLFRTQYPSPAQDRSAARESWGVFIDALCKGGEITLTQYETWGYPTYLQSRSG